MEEHGTELSTVNDVASYKFSNNSFKIKMKSALSSKPKYIGNFESRPYYENEFEIESEIWSKCVVIVQNLRSDTPKDNLLALEMFSEILKNPDLKPIDFGVIVQRCILDFDFLMEQSPNQQIRAVCKDVWIEVESKKEDLLGDMNTDDFFICSREDEMDRRRLIEMNWDGQMSDVAHRKYLDAIKKEKKKTQKKK